MNIIKLANHQLTYHVIYQKKRKSIQLKILSSTHLEIIAPDKLPLTSIEKILYEKSNWIAKQLARLETTQVNPTLFGRTSHPDL
jgi:predicted metal-dependent hydrolase